MSETKNTALGETAGFGYSQVSPHKTLSVIPTMITTLIILAALVLVTAWDDSETQSS